MMTSCVGVELRLYSKKGIPKTQEVIMTNDESLGSVHTAGRGQMINLDEPASPAVLSGLFAKNVSLIYQMRQDGKLPPNSDATYRASIKHYTEFLQNRASKKASNVAEASLLQKIQLDRAKTESEWLNLRVKRGELVDSSDLAIEFESYFTLMRGQLNMIARKFPETVPDIDGLLTHWSELGRTMIAKSTQELENFVENEMNKEIDLGESDE
jgi:hypothetical protein